MTKKDQLTRATQRIDYLLVDINEVEGSINNRLYLTSQAFEGLIDEVREQIKGLKKELLGWGPPLDPATHPCSCKDCLDTGHDED